MEIEFPLLVYSYQMLAFVNSQNITNSFQCTNFYKTQFGLKTALITALCKNSTDPSNYFNVTRFNFYEDPLLSSKAWVNIYLNNHTNNPADNVDLMLATGLNGYDINTTMHAKNSKIKTFFFTNVFKPIYDHYSPLGFCNGTYQMCSIKDITYM